MTEVGRPDSPAAPDAGQGEATSGFRPADERRVSLSHSEVNLIQSLFPPGAVVEDATYFDNYNLPCPVQVRVRLPRGSERRVVLRKRRRGTNPREAQVERMLIELGLPVPELLGRSEDGLDVLSLLDGENLQHFSMRSPEHVHRAMELLLEALKTFERISEEVRASDTQRVLEDKSLIAEFDAIPSGPWSGEPTYSEAARTLRPVLERVETRLSFTNGDHQPANFLTDGGKIVGFVDFEDACFRDPLIGIAKYPVYDLHPLNKAGFCDLYLERSGFTSTEFSARVALMCLATLQKEIPVRSGSPGDEKYKEHVLRLLAECVAVSVDLM